MQKQNKAQLIIRFKFYGKNFHYFQNECFDKSIIFRSRFWRDFPAIFYVLNIETVAP